MYGFHGRLLHIDLSNGQSFWHELEEVAPARISRRHRLGHKPALRLCAAGSRSVFSGQSLDLR